MSARKRAATKARQRASASCLERLPWRLKERIRRYSETRGLDETVVWLLNEHKIKVSETGLRNWLYTFRVTQQLEKNEAALVCIMRALQASSCGFTAAEVQEAGQIFFSEMALAQGDAKVWSLIQNISLRLDRMKLEQGRLKASLESKLEAGLKALSKHFQSNPEAMALYEQARALIGQETR